MHCNPQRERERAPPPAKPAPPPSRSDGGSICQELVAAAKADKLKGFEVIKAVHLEPEPFLPSQSSRTF